MIDLKQVLKAMSVDKFFTKLSVSLNAEKAQDKHFTLLVNFTDINESYLLTLNNSLLRHRPYQVAEELGLQLDNQSEKADTVINITHLLFIDLIIGEAGIKETLFGDDLSVEGSKLDLISFLKSFDKIDGNYNMVTP